MLNKLMFFLCLINIGIVGDYFVDFENPVKVVKKTYFTTKYQPRKSMVNIQTGSGFGSGFVIEGDYIVTNAHVISQMNTFGEFVSFYKKVYAVTYDNKPIELKVVAIDVEADIALLQGDLGQLPRLKLDIMIPKLGTEIYNVGSGNFEWFRMRVGTVSYIFKNELGFWDNWSISANIEANPGDSGSAVLDGDGEVVAVLAGGLRQHAILLPAHLIKDLKDRYENGYYTPPVLPGDLVKPGGFAS